MSIITSQTIYMVQHCLKRCNYMVIALTEVIFHLNKSQISLYMCMFFNNSNEMQKRPFHILLGKKSLHLQEGAKNYSKSLSHYLSLFIYKTVLVCKVLRDHALIYFHSFPTTIVNVWIMSNIHYCGFLLRRFITGRSIPRKIHLQLKWSIVWQMQFLLTSSRIIWNISQSADAFLIYQLWVRWAPSIFVLTL